MSSQKNKCICVSNQGCINPEIGKVLEGFDATLNQEPSINPARFQKMINHLFTCRFCRKQLSTLGKEILTAEMFWGGYFLKGKAKVIRRQLRTKLFRTAPHQRIKLMEEILKGFSEGKFTEELKKVELFLKDLKFFLWA